MKATKEPSGVRLDVDAETLRPLVRAIVAETLELLKDQAGGRTAERLAYTEAEAAALLGLASHQLRDERRRGRVEACEVVRGRIRYTVEQLRNYLARKLNE